MPRILRSDSPTVAAVPAIPAIGATHRAGRTVGSIRTVATRCWVRVRSVGAIRAFNRVNPLAEVSATNASPILSSVPTHSKLGELQLNSSCLPREGSRVELSNGCKPCHVSATATVAAVLEGTIWDPLSSFTTVTAMIATGLPSKCQLQLVEAVIGQQVTGEVDVPSPTTRCTATAFATQPASNKPEGPNVRRSQPNVRSGPTDLTDRTRRERIIETPPSTPENGAQDSKPLSGFDRDI